MCIEREEKEFDDNDFIKKGFNFMETIVEGKKENLDSLLHELANADWESLTWMLEKLDDTSPWLPGAQYNLIQSIECGKRILNIDYEKNISIKIKKEITRMAQRGEFAVWHHEVLECSPQDRHECIASILEADKILLRIIEGQHTDE